MDEGEGAVRFGSAAGVAGTAVLNGVTAGQGGDRGACAAGWARAGTGCAARLSANAAACGCFKTFRERRIDPRVGASRPLSSVARA